MRLPIPRPPERRSRKEWLVLVAPRLAKGEPVASIARSFGLSYSFVKSLRDDPSGDIERDARDRRR